MIFVRFEIDVTFLERRGEDTVEKVIVSYLG